ncbi:hypothetical protein SSS_03896 [Sarcoptes scabiei]|nr:hypothetical protein SSS_03896 [Sarcoptes scabiei]
MFQQILSFNDLFDFEQFLFSFFYYFFICLLISLICALFGVSLGFRKLYVNLLLKIFEFGKQRIENELHNKQIKQVNSSTSIYNLDEIDDDSFLEEFIDSEEKVFHLDHVCHLITKGIKTIVDDEVTKRFDTEASFLESSHQNK